MQPQKSLKSRNFSIISQLTIKKQALEDVVTSRGLFPGTP